ncbi:TPA: metallophosphoesterase [Streptococcus suis]|nr:metallophosphoesterase [Streptococcus suis]
MAIYYAMSDIHGYLDEFLVALEKVDFTMSENHLFILGDYIDNGEYSYQVLEKIRELESNYPNQVTALLGNHDEWFYHWLINEDVNAEYFPETIKSFFSLEELTQLFQKNPSQFEEAIRDEIKSNPKFTPFMEWFKRKYQEPRYIETDWQIFVHAGIDEEAGVFWKEGTDPSMFTNKFPVTTGKFSKDIISGHVGSFQVADNKDYLGKIFFDEHNHYFIDGTVDQSKVIPVLEFDTLNQTYNY